MSVYCSMLKFSKVYDGLGVGKRGKGGGGGAGRGGGGLGQQFSSCHEIDSLLAAAVAFKLNERFFLLEKNTALRAFSCLIIIPIFFSLFFLSFAVQYTSRIHERTNFVEVTVHNLESSRLEVSVYTLQTNFQAMFAQGSGGRGSDCDSKEENSKTFIPTTSKNSASHRPLHCYSVCCRLSN
jgi:hypothetical protein